MNFRIVNLTVLLAPYVPRRSPGMSTIFEAYVEEHTALCGAITRGIARLGELTALAERNETIASAEADLVKIEELVQQMELEARSVKSKDLQSRAKDMRLELSALRSSLKHAAVSLPRQELLGGGSSGDEATDAYDQRARLLKIGERVQEGTLRLQEAHRTVLETEAMGESILGDLRQQRQTITHASGTLQRANESLARSKRTLAAMTRRALGNKVMMIAMICMLIGLVALLGFVELFGATALVPKPPSPPSPPPPPPAPDTSWWGRAMGEPAE